MAAPSFDIGHECIMFHVHYEIIDSVEKKIYI